MKELVKCSVSTSLTMTSSRCNRFFHIIPRKSSTTLKIPENFTRRFGDGLSSPLFLKSPDGTEWEVYWTKNECEVWFQKGWEEFATYYSLDYGHLVLFEYEGNSYFGVHIFDMSALEIEYPLHNQICDASVEILSEQSPCKKKRLKSRMTSPQSHRKIVESSPNVQNMLQHDQIKGKQLEGTNIEMPIIASNQELDDGKSTKRTPLLISPHPGISGNMKEAKKFTSENPFFMIDIRQSHVEKTSFRYCPSISAVFVRKYFKTEQSVMIKLGKKLWSVKVLYYPSTCVALFSAGWRCFAEESKLQAGDVCIFELINREDSVLDVHIFSDHN